jgi:hypothetical protein
LQCHLSIWNFASPNTVVAVSFHVWGSAVVVPPPVSSSISSISSGNLPRQLSRCCLMLSLPSREMRIDLVQKVPGWIWELQWLWSGDLCTNEIAWRLSRSL